MGFFKADRIVIPPSAPAPVPAQTPTSQPPVVVVQQQPDPGIWTQNGKRYMSPLLAISYQASKLITPLGQAHLLSGATDQQLLDDYRNGDVNSSVLALYGISIPKGTTQIKQSPLMASPGFPEVAVATTTTQVVIPGGSWSFTVPPGWGYTLDTSSPTATVNATAATLASPPQNILFSVDAVRSTRLLRSDGGYDVTVYGEWTEVAPANYPVVPIPAGMYSAVILATLYPTDNPPPSA